MNPVATTPDRPPDRTEIRTDRRRRGGRRLTHPPDSILIAVLATVISGAAGGRPSFWFDEAATVSAAANRPLPDLCRLLTHIDAVHGLYYLVMHGWFTVFPATEFWSRLPSALAVGAGAAGVVVFTGQFCPRRVAVPAGVLFAILPRMTWAGIEARPYAFTAMAAVWLTVLCVTAVRRNTTRIWLAYGLAIVLATLLSTFSALVVLAQVAVVRTLPERRSSTAPFVATVAGALVVLTPFLWFSQTQVWQVGWISPLRSHTVVEVVAQQYFDKSVPFALLAGAALVAAAAARCAGVRRLPPGRSTQLLLICTAWIVVPTVATLVYSAVGKPVYYPRYLIGTAPAMAVLLAICLTTLVSKPVGVTAAVTLFAIAAAPNYVVTQRDRHAKEGWDYSEVADVIDAHAGDGDCLVVDNTAGWKPGPIRALPAARPKAFHGLADPGRGPPGAAMGRLWDGHVAVWAVADRLDRCTVIWAITNHDPALPIHQAGAGLPPGSVFARTPAGQVLHRLGFHPVERWQFSFSQVIRSVR